MGKGKAGKVFGEGEEDFREGGVILGKGGGKGFWGMHALTGLFLQTLFCSVLKSRESRGGHNSSL